MRRPEHPPSIDAVEISTSLVPRYTSGEFSDYLAKVNSAYYHWDEVSRRPMPPGVSPIEAWFLVSMTRGRRIDLPLTTPAGRPFGLFAPTELQRLLHRFDRAVGSSLLIDETTTASADERNRILIGSLMDESTASAQIEGAVTTRDRARQLLRSGSRPTDRSEQMIANGYRTVHMLRDYKAEPLSIDLLLSIQRSITENTLDDAAHAGALRTTDDVVVVDNRDNEVIYSPPPAKDLPARLDRMVAFANAPVDEGEFIHPLVRAAVLHFWLAYEHPFVDGNGRTARSLLYWYMLRQGYWLFEYLTVSRVIHQSRRAYYDGFLYSETRDLDLTYSVRHMLGAVGTAVDDLRVRLQALKQERSELQEIAIAARLNDRQRAVLHHALRNPNQAYTFESHQASHGIVYQTARTDLLDLVKKGFLVDLKDRKPRRFIPAPDLARKLKQR